MSSEELKVSQASDFTTPSKVIELHELAPNGFPRRVRISYIHPAEMMVARKALMGLMPQLPERKPADADAAILEMYEKLGDLAWDVAKAALVEPKFAKEPGIDIAVSWAVLTWRDHLVLIQKVLEFSGLSGEAKTREDRAAETAATFPGDGAGA